MSNLHKKVYQNSACNIAVSKNFGQLLSEIFDLNFKYIPNIVDTNYFNRDEVIVVINGVKKVIPKTQYLKMEYLYEYDRK